MKSVEKLGKSGAMLDGFSEIIHSLLAYFICDWPEGKRITLTKDGTLTALPCYGCLVPTEQLVELSKRTRNYDIRLVGRYKELV